MKPIHSLIALIILLFSSCATTRLQQQVKTFIKDKPVQIGVDITYDGKTVCSINAKKNFPMMSVFKLHQAIAVLDSLDNDTTRLSEKYGLARICCARIHTALCERNIPKAISTSLSQSCCITPYGSVTTMLAIFSSTNLAERHTPTTV